jgi:hypothetical protein
MKKHLIIISIVICLITSCNMPATKDVISTGENIPTADDSGLSETSPPTAAETDVDGATTQEPVAPPTARQPSPEPKIIDQVCVPPQTHERFSAPNFDDYLDVILAYINSGATPDELDRALYDAGVGNQPVALVSGDMTGDGKLDLVVSIFDPQSTDIPPAGTLLIYICQDAKYTFVHVDASDPGWSAPGIRYSQDINADGRMELITSSIACGAHTCYEEVKALVWNGLAFENRLEGISDDLPYPDIQITDYDGDGIFDIEITGSGIGSLGAGPQRNITRVWKFDPGTGYWVVGEEIAGYSDYRLHVLHDADDSTKRGEYDVAQVLYRRVIDDPSLLDWVDPPIEQKNLGAYAHFRIVALNTLRGKTGDAQAILDVMMERYPQGSPQYAYVEMAAGYMSTFVSAGVDGACAAASTYADANAENVLTPLGSLAFGYGNRDYKPEDMCP